ncbi:MAG: hypothetical protein WBE43_13000 [Candidatus Acidiferrales bacterium]
MKTCYSAKPEDNAENRTQQEHGYLLKGYDHRALNRDVLYAGIDEEIHAACVADSKVSVAVSLPDLECRISIVIQDVRDIPDGFTP